MLSKSQTRVKDGISTYILSLRETTFLNHIYQTSGIGSLAIVELSTYHLLRTTLIASVTYLDIYSNRQSLATLDKFSQWFLALSALLIHSGLGIVLDDKKPYSPVRTVAILVGLASIPFQLTGTFLSGWILQMALIPQLTKSNR